MHELGLWTILKISSGRNGYVSNCYPLVWKQFDGKYFESLCGTGVHSELRAFMAAENYLQRIPFTSESREQFAEFLLESGLLAIKTLFSLSELPVQVDDKFK